MTIDNCSEVMKMPSIDELHARLIELSATIEGQVKQLSKKFDPDTYTLTKNSIRMLFRMFEELEKQEKELERIAEELHTSALTSAAHREKFAFDKLKEAGRVLVAEFAKHDPREEATKEEHDWHSVRDAIDELNHAIRFERRVEHKFENKLHKVESHHEKLEKKSHEKKELVDEKH
jgi:hypothetical protein